MEKVPGILTVGSVYVIAEAGVNHNGDPALARQLVDVASNAGADAVKFQLFNPDEIVSDTAPLAEYQERSGEDSQKEMLKRLTLPLDEYRQLKVYAERKGIDFITTPFDAVSARFLAGLGVRAIKIPSGEITNIPFLEQVATLRIFTIISTGMSTIWEIREAVEPFKSEGTPYALLHCVSSYPAPIDQINLRAMETLRGEFNVPVGYSDHTEGIDVAVTAVALGAQILEKHFTLDRTMPGPDHAASLEPDALKEMMRIIKDTKLLKSFPTTEAALGSSEKRCQPCELNTRDVARRSVVIAMDVAAGQTLTARMLSIKRPGTGITPKDLPTVIGKKTKNALCAGTVLTSDLLQ